MADAGRLTQARQRRAAGEPGDAACASRSSLPCWSAGRRSRNRACFIATSCRRSLAIGKAIVGASGRPAILLASRRHRRRDRRGARDRRHSAACGRPRARRQQAPRQGLRALSLLSRADAQDHLLPDHDHVVRRRPGLQGRARRAVLLSSRSRLSVAAGMRQIDPVLIRVGQELPRQCLADGDQDLPAGDAPSDHQRRAARPRRRADRHAAGRNQAVQPRHRLSDHPGLQPVRHAAHVRDADRAVRACRSAPTRWSAGSAASTPSSASRKKTPEEMHETHLHPRAAALADAVAARRPSAQDTVKLAIGQRGNWDTADPASRREGRHLQEARHRSRDDLHLRQRRDLAAGDFQPRRYRACGRHAGRDQRLCQGRAGAHHRRGSDRRRRLLVCEGRFRHQDAEGHQRQDHRVLDQRLLDQFDRARLHQGIQPDRQAAWRPAIRPRR